MAAINAYAPLTPAMVRLGKGSYTYCVDVLALKSYTPAQQQQYHMRHIMLTPLLAALLLQDIFSLGCVIAELFMDGKAFLDLGTLLAYRRGEADPGRLLAAAGVPGDVMELVLHMIKRDPGAFLWVLFGFVICLCQQEGKGGCQKVAEAQPDGMLSLFFKSAVCACCTITPGHLSVSFCTCLEVSLCCTPAACHQLPLAVLGKPHSSSAARQCMRPWSAPTASTA
jgi:hypothetical protein